MPGHLIREPSMVSPEFRSFLRQEQVFTGLNLGLMAGLILAQFLLPGYLGQPHPQIVAILAVGILIGTSELVWLNRRTDLSWIAIQRLTWAAIAINLAIAFGLASYSYRQDIQYFALMIPPILQAAFRFPLSSSVLTVGVSDGLIFFWVWNYFRVHPPADPNEYIEAGTIALVYAVTSLLVWTLVNHLRQKQVELSRSLADLEKVEARLRIEEKLAAVGRFSSAIAHEIRNPVAMISSALATAANRDVSANESREMYEIATQEAKRLEQLTTDFLVYARPRPPQRVASDVSDSVGYTAEICRPRAAEAGVEIHCECGEGLWAEIDGGQLQQALLNLAMNAIEASQDGGMVALRAFRERESVHIEIENAGGPIPAGVVACIFEPFFTTKARGTGLGLAIARNILLGHGGDLLLAHNDAEHICFAAVLPASGASGGQ